ncbi:MAG: hypothetical protein ABL994_00035 [Verrucomicrobiales bacterium]
MHVCRASIFAWLLLPLALGAADPVVGSVEELNQQFRSAQPGTVIRLAPGTYRGGGHFVGLAGSAEQVIVIEAADPANPPLFSAEQGGTGAMQLSGCSHVTLRHLRVTGFPANGINADDGGEPGQLSRGLRFENLIIENTGPKGNHDALKLSGLGRLGHRHGWLS